MYTLVEVEPKNDYLKVQAAKKKMIKMNLTITAKPHAHLQTLTNKVLKKIQLKLLEELRSQEWTYFVWDSRMDRQTDAQGKTICLPTLMGARHNYGGLITPAQADKKNKIRK